MLLLTGQRSGEHHDGFMCALYTFTLDLHRVEMESNHLILDWITGPRQQWWRAGTGVRKCYNGPHDDDLTTVTSSYL